MSKNKQAHGQNFDYSGTHQEEVGLLAIMCTMFRPHVFRGHLFKKLYAYYVLNEDKDIEFARYLFGKNGVKTEKHESRIMGRDNKKTVLRMRYKNSMGHVQNQDFIDDVYGAFTSFGLNGMNAEWRKLEGILTEQRAKYNELEK